jgi:hypothetical protein
MKIQAGISDGQVLQRQGKRGASLQLQGICGQAGTVHATISNQLRALSGWKKVVVGKAARGRFTASLTGIPAGGPYRLELRVEKESARVDTFFVGDVWLLAGQSNMEGVGDMTGPARPHPLIRSFSMRREWCLAVDPLHILMESSDACHNEIGQPLTPAETRQYRRRARKGVGVGIFFARDMLKRSGVPQGLICAAHGGTTMTQWDPALKSGGGASLYDSMLLSVRATGQPVAGLLWYQGESDAGDLEKVAYTDRMKKLVAATRRDLRQPRLPWLVVQLARVFNNGEQGPAWNSIQEQQRLLPDKIKNLETVAAIDLPLDDSIHISATGYPRLGLRLGHVADYLALGNKKERRAPRLREIRLNDAMKNAAGAAGTSIDVVFDEVAGGLRAAGEPLGFTLVTEDGKIWPYFYKTTLHGNVARLHLNQPVDDKIKLHYGFGVSPVCTITDGRGLSLPVFGPLPLTKQDAYLDFVNRWRVADLMEPSAVSLADMDCPDLSAVKAVKTYGTEGFINEHEQWRKKNGIACFSAGLELPEAMKLQFLMGYDGPFRLWLDDQPLFTDLAGTNPCLPDQNRVTRSLTKGSHRLTVGMDINAGLAWGFMLRLLRVDVSKAQLKEDTYHRPKYVCE